MKKHTPTREQLDALANFAANKITFSVIVRDANSWDQSTGICAELANCGHAHRTVEAAQHCMDKLTAWHCLCGSTTKSYAPCCHTPHNSTSARWYHAHIEDSQGSQPEPQEKPTGHPVTA